MDADIYIYSLAEDMEVSSNLYVLRKESGGFYTRWYSFGNFIIEVPDKKFYNVSSITKMTLRHELGHVIFQCMLADSIERLREIVRDIKKHKFLCTVQRILYWNSLFRWIKGVLGFSSNTDYSYTDSYYGTEFSRGDNELFCDWFAVRGYYGLQ